MARYIGPKNKKARRIGKDLGLKSSPQKLQRRLGIPPGHHGRRGRGRLSDYGKQLLEKQRVRWTYGVLEKQFRKYFQKALKKKGATGEELICLLERRLDNVLYRLSFVPTRNMARQLISHGHIIVNNKKLSIPSYLTEKGDLVTLSAKALKIAHLQEYINDKKPSLPSWLSRKAVVGKVERLPEKDDLEPDIDRQLIVELYSK